MRDPCARCDDDTRLSRPAGSSRPAPVQRSPRCAVCGQPASFALGGEPLCARHYLERVAARARAA